MRDNTVLTWQAQIFCGLRVGYTEEVFSIEKVYEICQKYTNEIGWCVTVTPTKFIYKNGSEPGVIIGVIQYPRFSLSEEELRGRTITLAEILLVELGQFRISIVFPNEIEMIEAISIKNIILRKVEPPTNLYAAMSTLDTILSKGDKEYIDKYSEGIVTAKYHHSLGRWIRNNWGLWSRKGKLYEWFNSQDLVHPDDMSGIIITSYWRIKHQQPIRLNEQIQHYLDYWSKQNE